MAVSAAHTPAFAHLLLYLMESSYIRAGSYVLVTIAYPLAEDPNVQY